MREADYYPMGAYNDPSAPWNESVVSEKEFEITCSQTLSKICSVLTDKYTPCCEEVCEDGHCYVDKWDDTSEIVWSEEFHDNDHYDALHLIQLFQGYLKDILNDDKKMIYNKEYIEHLIEECDDWDEDEIEFVR